jgi:hypothetical protein
MYCAVQLYRSHASTDGPPPLPPPRAPLSACRRFNPLQKWANPVTGWTSTGDPMECCPEAALSFYTPEQARGERGGGRRRGAGSEAWAGCDEPARGPPRHCECALGGAGLGRAGRRLRRLSSPGPPRSPLVSFPSRRGPTPRRSAVGFAEGFLSKDNVFLLSAFEPRPRSPLGAAHGWRLGSSSAVWWCGAASLPIRPCSRLGGRSQGDGPSPSGWRHMRIAAIAAQGRDLH